MQISDIEAIQALGVLLYGTDWRRPLAREIGVSDALVRAIASGRRRLSDAVRAGLFDVAVRERGRLGERDETLRLAIEAFEAARRN